MTQVPKSLKIHEQYGIIIFDAIKFLLKVKHVVLRYYNNGMHYFGFERISIWKDINLRITSSEMGEM